jgi:hypothetical protein
VSTGVPLWPNQYTIPSNNRAEIDFSGLFIAAQ